MKNLLKISLVALFTAVPMLAKAVDPSVTDAAPTQITNDTGGTIATAATATTPPKYALEAAGTYDSALATGGYVKGAYNAAIKAVNRAMDEAKAVAESQATLRAGNALSAANTYTDSAVATAVSALDATVTSSENDELNVTIVETDGKLTSVTANLHSGVIGADHIKTGAITADRLSSEVQTALNNATGQAAAISAAVSALDATVTSSGTDDVEVTVVETDGKLTAVRANINSGAVQSGHIASGAVTSDKIASDAVTSAKLASSAVLTDKIAQSAVTSAKIAELAVTTDKIQSGAVATAKLADSAVTSDKIADLTITGSDIAQSTITMDKLESSVQTALNAANAAAGNLTSALTAYTTTADLQSNYATKTGVVATINASTVPVLTVWGSDSATAFAISAPASYVASSAQ